MVALNSVLASVYVPKSRLFLVFSKYVGIFFSFFPSSFQIGPTHPILLKNNLIVKDLSLMSNTVILIVLLLTSRPCFDSFASCALWPSKYQGFLLAINASLLLCQTQIHTLNEIDQISLKSGVDCLKARPVEFTPIFHSVNSFDCWYGWQKTIFGAKIYSNNTNILMLKLSKLFTE